MRIIIICLAIMCLCFSCSNKGSGDEGIRYSSDIQEKMVEDDYAKGRIDSCYVDGQLIVYDYHCKRNEVLCYLDINKPGYSYTRHEIDKDAYINYRESVEETIIGAYGERVIKSVINAVLSSFSEDTVLKMKEEDFFPFHCVIKYDWNGKIVSVAFRIKENARRYIDGSQIIKMTELVKRDVKFPPMYPNVGHTVVAQNFRIAPRLSE